MVAALVLVLLLAVAAALAINAFGLTSNEFAWGAVWSITPVLATVIMLLVVTREGYTRKGWQSLGLHRLGLRMWPIAFFGTLAITVAATAAVWATPLASVTAPAGGGIMKSAVSLVIKVALLATTFSLAEEIGIRGYLLPRLLPLAENVVAVARAVTSPSTLGVRLSVWAPKYAALNPSLALASAPVALIHTSTT